MLRVWWKKLLKLSYTHWYWFVVCRNYEDLNYLIISLAEGKSRRCYVVLID